MSNTTRKTIKLCRIDFDATGEFEALVRHLDKLTGSPEIFEGALRNAVAETLLINIRQRFVRNLPNALEMMRASGAVSLRERDTPEMREWEDLSLRLSAAQRSGSKRRIDAAQEALGEAKARFVASLDRRANKRKNADKSLSSGLFRPYALKVLSIMADAGRMRGTKDRRGLHVSVGNRSMLERVHTPSATEFALHMGKTTSKYDIMWRHLEFGTGKWAKDPEAGLGKKGRRAKDRRLPNGHWRYNRGLVLRGTKGLHALRAETGELYAHDTYEFQEVFALYMTNALRVPGKR